MASVKDSLDTRIRASLKRGTNKVLLSDESVSWTGEDLSHKIQELGELIAKATPVGARVGISFPNSAIAGLAILSVIVSKRVPVILCRSDLNTEDIAKGCKISFLITQADDNIAEEMKLSIPHIKLSKTGEIASLDIANSKYKWWDGELHRPPAGTALILYTSGSTGKPKGIFVPETGILMSSDFLTEYFSLNDKTVSPIILPIWHSMGLNTQFIPTFLAGGHSYFVNPHLGMSKAYRNILLQKGTFVGMIGEVLRACWEEKNRKGLPAADHVEHIQLAGGMITPQHISLAKDLFPNAKIHKGYGLTEAIRVTMLDSEDESFQTNSVGKPLPFVDIEIRDAEGDVITGNDEVGEVFVRGPNVLLGVSGTTLSPVGRDGFLGTGDLGYWNSQGHLCISGRADSLFKINGHRVSGLEIEAIAMDVSEWIRAAKCLAVDDPRRAGKKIVLFVEIPLNEKFELIKHQMDHIRNKLWVKFKTLKHFPKEIFVVEKFPRTSNGKLSMIKLTELCSTGPRKQLMENSQSSLQFYSIFQQNKMREEGRSHVF